ncbi:MAG: hypothetical protein IIC54_08950 [Proteobacteria bacterium]|nr:hypothetical protein [Pseudomonadota bacterium]
MISAPWYKRRPRLPPTAHTLLGILAVAALAGPGGPAAAGEGPAGPLPEIARVQTKAQKCVRLGTQSGREILVNACPACRIVHLERKRPGGAFPAQRTYTVPESSRVTLSFRGPGRTRILTDEPCRGASPADAGEESPGTGRQAKCIHLRRTTGGPVVLFNGCRACRAVVVERTGPGGVRKTLTFAVAGGSSVPLARPGAPVQARIVAEKPCR